MVLGEDTVQRRRHVLLSSGQVLNTTLIRTREKREIKEIIVQDVTETGSAEREQGTGQECQTPIDIQLSHDQMTAFLTIQLRQLHSLPELLTVEILKSALHAKGVVFGILEQALRQAVEDVTVHGQPVTKLPIAKGAPPSPGRQGDLKVKVPYVSSAVDRDKLASIEYACELGNMIQEGYRVNPGTTVAIRSEDIPPQQGTDICGKPILTSDIVPLSIHIGDHIEPNQGDNEFKSTVSGVVSFVAETISVHPVNFDAKFQVTVGRDKMEAILTIQPPGEQGQQPTIAHIKEQLAEAGVVFGISENRMAELVEQARAGVYVEDEVVAEGKPPLNGQDGTVEFLVDIANRGKPVIRDDGTANFKDIRLLQNVEQGQELARLTPPTKGKPGMNVLGSKISSYDGKPARLPVGSNTEPMTSNDQVLVSTCNGFARLNAGVIDVSEALVIPGDVDYSTGNIHYNKSVLIQGDVKSGFQVLAGGDLEIWGTVEDAKVECGGSVLVKCGFTGSGQGCIRAKENVSVAFVRNQEIRALNDIYVAKEVIAAKLWAKNEIQALGQPFSIVGGQTTARNTVEAFALGNDKGIKTPVEVGIDFTLLEEHTKLDQGIKELLESRLEVRQNVQRINHILQLNKDLPAEDKALLQKFENMDRKTATFLETMENRKNFITEQFKDVGNAKVTVRHMAYPGANVKIRERQMRVDAIIDGPKVFRYAKGKIKSLSINNNSG